ncbi:hypothetical protein [uncultured Brachyspira sp.]|uniref:hypothetical protein n=1 Tax=uncultured Brachyspira sp. TaxID=221953 RepID=UPI002638B330|nr:hypothetical protein [uncultured Brachyspira sp.]
MSFTVAAIITILVAAGIIIIFAFLSVAKLVAKLKEKHTDFFKAKIKKNYTTCGVDTIDVNVEDIFGNTIASESYASLDGISSSLYAGREINKYSS